MATTRRAVLAAGSGMILAGPAAPAGARTRWQAASPWPEGNCHSRNLRQFLEDVRQATDNTLEVQLHDGGTLLKASGLLRGVQAGQVQICDMLLSAQAALDPVMEVDALPMLVRSLEEARRLAALSRPAIAQRLQREGVTLLYLAAWSPQGLFSGFPVDSLDDLRGTRMRTMTAMAARLASLAGALSAQTGPEQRPQGSAARVAVTMFASATTGVDVQAWNFARFYTPLDITYPKNAVCVQSRAWEALPARRRAALREAAAAAEERAWSIAGSEGAAMQKLLAGRGVTIRPATPGLLAGLAHCGQVILEEWRARAGAPGARLLEALRTG
jgi:TRAP-type C4-dicarboxylate transport system substrate-binding protein